MLINTFVIFKKRQLLIFIKKLIKIDILFYTFSTLYTTAVVRFVWGLLCKWILEENKKIRGISRVY